MKFQKDNFKWDGMYLHYGDRFVARFKHSRKNKASFQSFLIKNFEVEEYFSLLEDSTPVQVLQTKGYVSRSVANFMKIAGYSPDYNGYQKYLSDSIAHLL